MALGRVDVGSDEGEGITLPGKLSGVGVAIVAEVMSGPVVDAVVTELEVWMTSKSRQATIVSVPVVVR